MRIQVYTHYSHCTAEYTQHGKAVIWASLVAQMVKNLPAVQEIQVRSLGREDPLEKEMGTHSSILAWRIPWTEEPGRLQSTGSQSWTPWKRLSTYTNEQVLLVLLL